MSSQESVRALRCIGICDYIGLNFLDLRVRLEYKTKKRKVWFRIISDEQ